MTAAPAALPRAKGRPCATCGADYHCGMANARSACPRCGAIAGLSNALRLAAGDLRQAQDTLVNAIVAGYKAGVPVGVAQAALAAVEEAKAAVERVRASNGADGR